MEEVIGTTTAPRRFNALLLGVFAAIALVWRRWDLQRDFVFDYIADAGDRYSHGARCAPAGDTDDGATKGNGTHADRRGDRIGRCVCADALDVELLFGISASDPATYVIVLLVALGAALLACSIPRAARRESIRSLHCAMSSHRFHRLT